MLTKLIRRSTDNWPRSESLSLLEVCDFPNSPLDSPTATLEPNFVPKQYLLAKKAEFRAINRFGLDKLIVES